MLVKCEISCQLLKGIAFFNFEWHGQNKVGNIAILALWRDREKLYLKVKDFKELSVKLHGFYLNPANSSN